jgi:hypothetical protein
MVVSLVRAPCTDVERNEIELFPRAPPHHNPNFHRNINNHKSRHGAIHADSYNSQATLLMVAE